MSTESDTKQATTDGVATAKSTGDAFFSDAFKTELRGAARTGILVAVICTPFLALSVIAGRLTKA